MAGVEQRTQMITGVDFADENSVRYGAIIQPLPEDTSKTQLIAQALISESLVSNTVEGIDSMVEGRRLVRNFSIYAGYFFGALTVVNGASDIFSGHIGPGLMETTISVIALKLLYDRQKMHWGLRNASVRAIQAESDK